MTRYIKPTPKQKAPDLELGMPLGKSFVLKDQNPSLFTMVIFYRGLHCPVCRKYLEGLQKIVTDYKERGVEVIAVSMDTEARARKTAADWEIDQLRIGYGLKKEAAQQWGLYLSSGIKEGEPDLFSEPAMYLVKPDNEIYYAAINSAPWGRPDLKTFLKRIDFIKKENYPARGEFQANDDELLFGYGD